jgi:hypothetical protein
MGETVRGLVYSGLGAYVFALQLLISRINTGSLTARFLIRLAAQSAIALILGVTAAQLGVGFAIASERQTLFLYFLLGLFPGLARQALQRRGRVFFAPEEAGYESLPLTLVDGIDDETVDRLTEMGISDIQHLATVDPVDFMLRAGYAPMRVLDWIDQAMFITYVRRRVTFARAYGIRGAIDFAVLYLDYDPNPPTAQMSDANIRAKAIVPALSTRMELPQEVLLSIGRAMWEDDNLHFVWLLWMNRVFWDNESDDEVGSGGQGGPVAQITKDPVSTDVAAKEPPGLHLSGEQRAAQPDTAKDSAAASQASAQQTESKDAKTSAKTETQANTETKALREEDQVKHPSQSEDASQSESGVEGEKDD